MVLSQSAISTGYLLAGANNAQILLFSKGLSDDLGRVDPLFDASGSVCILLWGMAYASVHDRAGSVPLLSLVFGLEKVFYGQRWVRWMAEHAEELPGMLDEDPLTGAFFALYGVGDIASAALFLYCAYAHRRNFPPPAKEARD